MAEIENLKIGANGTIHIVGNENIITEEWESSKTYVKDKSYVIREHKLYVCNVTHTSTSSFDPTKWTEITVIGAIDNALDMTDTASGAIATFESEYALPLRNLEIEINAVQEGSGTPSPDNVRPITGFTGANVTRCGVNLMHVDSRVSQTTAKVTYTSDDNYIYLNGVKYGSSYAVASNLTMTLPCGTYYLKAFVISGTASNSVALYAFDGKNDISPNILGHETSMTLNNTTTFSFRFAIWSDSTVLSNYKIGIVISKASVNEYSEYNGSIYNIAFTDGDNPLTVYGGSLDATSGKLTVTHARVDLGSLTQWNKNTSFTNTLFVANVSDKKTNNGNCICTNYINGGIATGETFLNNMQNNNFASDTSNGIYIRDDSKSNLSGDDFKTAMSGVYLVYELATLVTYQLTPTQISAIVGTNNVFTDTNGDTTLEYYTKRGEQTVHISEATAKEVINSATFGTLNTTDKTIVGAVNEVDSEIGSLSDLTTTDKSSIVGAVNSIVGWVDATSEFTKTSNFDTTQNSYFLYNDALKMYAVSFAVKANTPDNGVILSSVPKLKNDIIVLPTGFANAGGLSITQANVIYYKANDNIILRISTTTNVPIFVTAFLLKA